MYWADWGSNPKIEKASMDGALHQVIVNSHLGMPNGLTIDYASQIVYWTDRIFHTLERCRSDGSDRMVLNSNAGQPFGIALFNGTLYWGDLETKAVYKAPVMAPNMTDPVLADLIHNPRAMHIVSKERQPLGNPL